MLIEKLTDNSNINDKNYDVAILGSGPAGISLALRLAKQTGGIVLLIESGGLAIDPDISALSSVQSRGDFEDEYYPVHAQRVLGGTSAVWSGYCTTMEKRAFIANQWPIPYEDIEAYYKDAADILELPLEAWQTPFKTLPANGNIVYRPYHLSPPVRFNDKYQTVLSSHKNIDVLLNSTCSKVVTSGGKVESLLVQDSLGQSDKQTPITANQYVMACGGFGNPRLMQLSGIGEQSPVGNYFSEHPHIYAAGEMALCKSVIDPLLSTGRTVHALQMTDQFCVDNKLLSFTVSFDLEESDKQPFFGQLQDVYVTKGYIRAEMLPQKENRISLGESLDQLKQPVADVDFHFNYQALAKKSWDVFAQQLLASGAGRATTALESYPSIVGGGHFIGTTRMGKSATDSVVDGNCKVHSLDNLYVAGSSVFAQAGAANPTFTIVAMALRLADHLTKKLQG